MIRGYSFTGGVTASIPHALGKVWTSYRIENILGAWSRFFAAHVPATDASIILVTPESNCIADVRVW